MNNSSVHISRGQTDVGLTSAVHQDIMWKNSGNMCSNPKLKSED